METPKNIPKKLILILVMSMLFIVGVFLISYRSLRQRQDPLRPSGFKIPTLTPIRPRNIFKTYLKTPSPLPKPLETYDSAKNYPNSEGELGPAYEMKPIDFLYSKTPIETDFFSIDFSVDQKKFIVKIKEPQTKNKDLFFIYLQQQQVDFNKEQNYFTFITL